ncbi:MAG TPA: multicopper oxidase domain-containing protein [Thermomicrobiales bacterium]|nr:multicopper oxidase domain-containing protein [Thermomicrobiales bacterium]
MGVIQFPVGPLIDDEHKATLLDHKADRRRMLRGGVALGAAAATLTGVSGLVTAQETPTPGPPGASVGSDPHSESTGHASPAPVGKPEWKVYDPRLKAVQPGEKKIELTARDVVTYLAKDVPYGGWSFDGTIPGPALRVRQGDKIDFEFEVDPKAATAHSVDFHAAQTPPDKNYKTIMPGQKFSWSFTPNHPGAFLYHCGTPPVLMHIGTGMYGAMIVDPKEGWPPAQELIFIQSDFYLKDSGNGIMVADYTKMLGNGNMDYVTFNGYANQYVENPISVKVGQPIRIFVVNAGPNVWASFHVVGAIFDKGYFNANPKNALEGLQSMPIGPGDGACVEFTLAEPGLYTAVNHSFGHAAHGAIAVLKAS